MAYNAQIEEQIEGLISDWKDIDRKKMFGGICYLTRGNMCFGIWKDFLIVRTGTEVAEEKLKEIIFSQNEPGDFMYIILDGRVQIIQDNESASYILTEFSRGDFFGEMALFSGHRRTVTARAVEQTVLMPVQRDQFLERVRENPDAALHIILILIFRLRRIMQTIA